MIHSANKYNSYYITLYIKEVILYKNIVSKIYIGKYTHNVTTEKIPYIKTPSEIKSFIIKVPKKEKINIDIIKKYLSNHTKLVNYQIISWSLINDESIN